MFQPAFTPWPINSIHFFGEDKNFFIKFYDDAVYPQEASVETVLSDYVLFARETIFEEIREKHFPHMPSRQRCVWLIPDSENLDKRLKFWLKEKKAFPNNCQILKLSCSGKVHYANQQYLSTFIGTFNKFRGNAFMYWSGCDVNEQSIDIECILEGFVRVEDIIPFPHE